MASPRSRTPLIIGIVVGATCLVLIVVLLLAIAAGGLLFWKDSAPDATTGPEGGGQGDGQELVLPPGVSEGEAFLPVGESVEGPVVDVYLDFLCPHCATFHEAQGDDLAQLAQDGEITLQVHPRAMLDPTSTPAGYSGRAANAAVCAYAEDPTQWSAAEEALFTDQPGADGLSDQELTQRIQDATGLDVADCITEGTYVPWIQQVVEPEAQASTQGTPAVLIDGEEFRGDISAPGSLKEAIAAA